MTGSYKVRTFTEFTGAMGIVLSLIFVGLEPRHTNAVAEVDAVLQINSMFLECRIAASHDPKVVTHLATVKKIQPALVRRGFGIPNG